MPKRNDAEPDTVSASVPPAAKPKRTNVLFLAACMVVVATMAMVYAALNPDGDTSGAMAIVGGVAVGLAALGTEILRADAKQFDAHEAAHLERMAALEGEAEAKMAWHTLTGQAMRHMADMYAERKRDTG